MLSGLEVSGDSNVSCCTSALICAFSNYFKTNSVWYFRVKCKKTSNCIDNVLISVNFAKKDFGGVLSTGYVENNVIYGQKCTVMFPVKGQMINRIAQF